MRNSLYIVAILAVMANLAFAETSVDSKVTVGQEQTANTIQTTIGEEFVITFDADKAAGYEWKLAAPIDNKLIKSVSSDGKSSWTFKAVQAGKTRISFDYIKARKRNAPPAKKAVYIVNIQKSVEAAETTKVTEKLIPYSAAYNSPDTGADPVDVVEDAE